MTTINLIQGTPEWRQARCGSLGASRIAEALARTKTGWGASRANLMAELICERLTGIPADSYTNAAMQWGIDTEPMARAAYSFHSGFDVVQVGLIHHPRIAGTHASPDGLVSGDGLVEIKCPNSATHIETLLVEGVPEKYLKQAQWQMACTDRHWCDWVSFDPRMPESMRLFIKRIARDEKMISDMEKEVLAFLRELESKVQGLRQAYEKQEAA